MKGSLKNLLVPVDVTSQSKLLHSPQNFASFSSFCFPFPSCSSSSSGPRLRWQPAAPTRGAARWAVRFGGSPKARGEDAHHMAAGWVPSPPEERASGRAIGRPSAPGSRRGGVAGRPGRARRERRAFAIAARGVHGGGGGGGGGGRLGAVCSAARLQLALPPGTPPRSIATLLTFGADVTAPSPFTIT